MKQWFARLFGSPREADSAHVHTVHAPAAPIAPADGEGEPATINLDLAFFHWLVGPHVSGQASADNVILDELIRLTRDPQAAAALVPRVPAVIPQLLRSLRDQDSSSGDLARQLAQDAVLVAEVIREVNSPYYQPATPVRNLEGALLLLGQNGLRMLLARVAFRPIISLQAGALARLAAPQLWRQSEGSALAASLLAPHHGADPFEAYLAGLMHNIGLVVALRVIDQLLPGGGLPDDDVFGARLIQGARLMSAGIAGQWELPPAIGHAIAHAGDPDGLPAALGEADRLAKLQMLAGGGHPDVARAVQALAPDARQVYDKLSEKDQQREA